MTKTLKREECKNKIMVVEQILDIEDEVYIIKGSENGKQKIRTVSYDMYEALTMYKFIRKEIMKMDN